MNKEEGAKLGSSWRLLQVILGFLAAFLVFFGFYHSATCFLSDPPICNTLMDGVPFFILSFILLIVAIRIEFRRALSSQEPLEEEKFKAASSKKVNWRMAVLFVTFSLLLSFAWYDEITDGSDIEYPNLSQDCNDTVVGPDVDLVNADFSNMKLRGCDLSNRDLTGAVFSETNLACVDFSNSILKRAQFTSPDVRGTIFDNADLSDADFKGDTRKKDYYNPEIVRCDYDLSFKGANLTNANFAVTLGGNPRCDSKLTFDNAIMYNTNLVVEYWGYSGFSFDNAILDHANLVTVYWSCSDAADASVSMVNVSFIGTNVSTTLPLGTDLSQSHMSEANFIDFLALDLASCPLSLPETYNCAEISGKKMIFGPAMDFSDKWISFWDNMSKDADFSGSNFSGFYIPNSIFQAVRFNDSNMSDSNLSNSNFTYNHKIYNEQYLEYGDCINSDNCSAYAETALEEWGIVDFSDFKYLWSSNLTNVDFTGSNLSYSDFSYSNMTGANLENADLTGAIWHYTICPDGTNSGKTGSCIS